jgi:hypothetical protein
MIKPNKDFRLSKTSKRVIALMGGSAEQRNGWKRMFIDAEISERVAKLAKVKEPKGDRE